MDNIEMKQAIESTFNTVAPLYDCHALRFFTNAAGHLVEQLALRGDEQVLDIACGTGQVTTCLGHALPTGSVWAVDLAQQMLDQAQQRAKRDGLSNIRFEQGDVDGLSIQANMLDAISCGFGLFFLPDIKRSVSHVSAGLKPGGRFIFSTFTGNAFSPMTEMAFDALAPYGVEPPKEMWRRLDTKEKHHQLLNESGFDKVSTQQQQCGYYLANVDEWWDVLWNAGFRSLLMTLSEQQLAEFREKHLAEVAELSTEQGIWLNIEVLISQGVRS